MRPTVHASSITRSSTGLTEAHRELIRMLAEIAVENYLAETEVDEPVEDRDEVVQ